MKKIYTMSELKESRLLYDRKAPAFGIIITIFTALLLVSALLWAGFATKTYVIKATGVVVSEEKVNVMNYVSGAIVSIAVEEGQEVVEGDTLIEIDSFQTELQIEQLKTTLIYYNQKLDNCLRLIEFVNGYLLADLDTQKNPFDKNNVNEIKMYADADYFISYVKAQIDQSAGSENEFTQSSLDDVKNAYLTQQSVYSNLEQTISDKMQQESQLFMYENSLAEYTIKAEQSGMIHLSSGLTIGTVLQSGTLLGHISCVQDENLCFSVIVSATERSKLTLGGEVEIAVSGAMQTEFGTLRGKIIAIDSDSTQTEEGQIYFIVKVKPDKTELTDKHGHKVNLRSGMIGECRIKYDETTWLTWIAEQVVGKFR